MKKRYKTIIARISADAYKIYRRVPWGTKGAFIEKLLKESTTKTKTTARYK